MGKGSKRRVEDQSKIEANWDRVFTTGKLLDLIDALSESVNGERKRPEEPQSPAPQGDGHPG